MASPIRSIINGERITMTKAARLAFPNAVHDGVALNLYCRENGVLTVTVIRDGRKSREYWAASLWRAV